MRKTPWTQNDVLLEADQVVSELKKRLSDHALSAHLEGYHEFSTQFSNLKYRIEQAYEKWVEEVAGL